MISQKNVIAVILARKGSKRIPGKNVKNFAGRPLIEWSLESAQNSNYIDKIVVSTDSEDVAEISKKFSRCSVIERPDHLASDTATSVAAMLHAVEREGDDSIVLLLQCTSPMTTTSDIDTALSHFSEGRHDTLVSVAEMEENPFHAYYENDGNLIPVARKEALHDRTQDHPKCYRLNGALYISTLGFLIQNNSFISDKTLKYVMSHNSSVDIDTPEDFERAEQIFNQMKKD